MNTITKLPDGSAFFTANVMSKEEAEKLPLKERPICFRISSEMYHAVFEHIGEASMCWNPRPSDEVFNSEKASDVAVRLCFKIAEEVENAKLESRKQGMTDAAEIARTHAQDHQTIQPSFTGIVKSILTARDVLT